MPSLDSNRRNLEHARSIGRVKFWRTRSESQRVKAEIVWLHHTKPDLSQRVIARMFRISQPYVARLLKRVRLSSGLEKALGEEAYRHYRELLEVQRREHFQSIGGPASLTSETPLWADTRLDVRHPPAVAKPECPAIQYVELGRTTTGEVIEIYGSRPVSALTDNELQQRRNACPAPAPPASSWVTQFTAKEIAGLFVADQCPSFGRR